MSSEARPEEYWTPIEPIFPSEKDMDLSEFSSLQGAWAGAREQLEERGPERLAEFLERLRRWWSVETGILENLYVLDLGTTRTLIERGFYEEFVNSTATNVDPGLLVEILRDHLEAGEDVWKLIADEVPLGPQFIKHLQSTLTRHQEWAEVTDRVHHTSRVPLLRGEWKVDPNGMYVEGGWRWFCPPGQVQGQIDELLDYLRIHEQEGINICILAAWFHYCFTSIHPFQDGNGRVARTLVNYLFVRNHLFPVVIDRDQKLDYLRALESADGGRLEPLARLFADRQIQAIKQALSLNPAEPESPGSAAVVKEIARGILRRRDRRREQEQASFRNVNVVATNLWRAAAARIQAQLEDFRQVLAMGGLAVGITMDMGGPESQTDYFYKTEIVEDVISRAQWANFNEEARWVCGKVRHGTGLLRFVVSFHHIGRELSGVAEATCFARLEEPPSPDDPAGVPQRTPIRSMERPFSLTWQDEAGDLNGRFEDWVTECLAIALRRLAETL